MKLPFDLNLFSEEYIALALKLAEANPSLQEFDSSLRKAIADKMGILEKEVLFLHHSFHWVFFCDAQSDSPIGLSFDKQKRETYVMQLERVNSEEKDRLMSYLMNKYGTYLSDRLKNLVSTPLQSA